MQGKMLKSTNKRDSKYELLRIICMVMIVAFHYSNHGNSSSIFHSPFSINQLIAIVFGSWGLLGTNCFLFISAHFLIESKSYKASSLVRIVLQTIFFSVVIGVGLTASGIKVLSAKQWVQVFISPFISQYWFVTAYIMLYLIYPYLNKLINQLKAKEYLYLLFVLTILIPVYKSIWPDAPLGNFGFVVYLYLVLGYIKTYRNSWCERHAKKGFIFTTLFIIIATQVLCIIANKAAMLDAYATVLTGKFSPFMVLDAVFLFCIFMNAPSFHSAAINKIGKATFGVYLFHENPILGLALWDDLLKVNIVYYKPDFILYLIASVAILFITGLLIELFRDSVLERILFKYNVFGINKICRCLDNKAREYIG